jgi:hypothetical protein
VLNGADAVEVGRKVSEFEIKGEKREPAVDAATAPTFMSV